MSATRKAKAEGRPITTVTDEEAREIEAALVELAAAIRADSPGREPLVGYYLRQILCYAKENNRGGLDQARPRPDALHRRKIADERVAFDAIDEAMGTIEAAGLAYDSGRRYKPIVRLAGRIIARLERGE